MGFNVSVVSKRIDVKSNNNSDGETTRKEIRNTTQHSTVFVKDLHNIFQLHHNTSGAHGQNNDNMLSAARLHHRNKQARLASHTAGADSCQARLFEPQVSYQGVDTLAGSLDRPAGDAAACCRACVSSPPCTHWTWYENGCSLKHGQLAPITMQWAADVISGRVPLDVRIERLRVPPNPNVPRSKVPCLRDEEDEPFFNADPPPR